MLIPIKSRETKKIDDVILKIPFLFITQICNQTQFFTAESRFSNFLSDNLLKAIFG